MASFGRSCEKTAEAFANLAEGINQRWDENHIVDLLVTLKDEEITVDEFKEFTTVIKDLRNGKKALKNNATTNP